MARSAVLVPALLTAVVLSACGGDPGVVTPASLAPSPSASSPSPAAPTAQRCVHPTEGYAVEFPAGWHLAGGEGIEPCSFFHPEPVELEPATEADGVAVRLDVLPDAFPEARRKVESDGEQRAAEETAIDGRRAVRYAGETDDLGLLPPGLATTTWLVDMGGRTLLLTTDEGGRDDYATAVEVLDDMARSVEVLR